MSHSEKQSVCRRVEALRAAMRAEGLDAYVVFSTDPHAGEYVPAHWQTRAWLSGFDGSAGTAVVTLADAALWTDSRYFLAADEALAGTPFTLMRMGLEGTPSIGHWLAALGPKARVGFDGLCSGHADVEALRAELGPDGPALCPTTDLVGPLWPSRPPLPSAPVTLHPLQLAGEPAAHKLQRVRGALAAAGCTAMLVSALDEVAWTLNLRGTDVPCNPVFVAYLLIAPQRATLFVDERKLPPAVRSALAEAGVDVAPYDAVGVALQHLGAATRLLLPPATNEQLVGCAAGAAVRFAPSPVAALKAVKNEAEIHGFHRAMERDGVAMVKFLRWLLPAVQAGGQSEISVADHLAALRAEQPLFRDLSFATIAGYGAHGAIVHYEATPASNTALKARGLLLLDSGAQYADGTTDITRTVALGPVSEEERRVFTLVLKGHIALSCCRFPEGATGTQLDLAARYALWQCGLNYGHGTGHGVGSYLNVHEGPHQIRMNYVPAPIRAGMTVTDEPGVYVSGRFGVRHENTLLVVPYKETEFGRFVQFEPLTLCPFDLSPVDWALLRPDEVAWLNDYHATVRARLMPLLTDEADRRWLLAATTPRRADGRPVAP